MDPLLQYSDLSDRLSSEMTTYSAPTTDSNNNSDKKKNNNHIKSEENLNFNSSIKIKEEVKEDKYSLRPRSMKRVTQQLAKATNESNKKQSKAHKPKQKPAPLSKYRRKTANARERNRMREINQAFETLRRVVPQMQIQPVPGTNEKLTKITTLRLAMKYISSLSAVLNGSDIPSVSDFSDFDYLLLESDGESLPLSDHSILASPDDFPEASLSPVDFSDPTLPPFFHSDFSDHTLDSADFADFLLA